MNQPSSKDLEVLVAELHRAGEHFHACKTQLEGVMDGADYRHEERMAEAREQLREAEREVEEVERKISGLLATDAKAGPESERPS